jgi:hypothetical protein
MTPEADSPSSTVVTTYRDLGKWMFASVGIIFAALVGAIGFAGIGKLNPTSSNFWLASGAALVTLVSIGFIAWKFARVLEPFPLTNKVFQAAKSNQSLRDTLDSFVPTFFKGYGDWLERYLSWQTRRTKAEVIPKGNGRDAALKDLEDEKGFLIEGRSQVNDVLMYAEVSRRYATALSTLALAGCVAILGSIGFNVLTAKSDPIAGSAPFVAPTIVNFTPNAGTKASLQSLFGKDCALDRLQLIRLGTGDLGTEYVSIPSENCTLQRLILDASSGSFTAPKQ